MNGKVSALLELGAGFHPELTGRENVFLNGAILGLSQKELRRRFDEIVDFAGVGAFIDEPVKNYSSGMYVRLGFSVAINVDPDVLLIDEVLAVGDEAFQRKCNEKLAELRNQGKTIVFVSHGLGQVQNLCDRAAWFSHGRLMRGRAGRRRSSTPTPRRCRSTARSTRRGAPGGARVRAGSPPWSCSTRPGARSTGSTAGTSPPSGSTIRWSRRSSGRCSACPSTPSTDSRCRPFAAGTWTACRRSSMAPGMST